MFMAAPSSVRKGEGGFCSTSCSTTFHRRDKRSNNWKGGRKVVESGHVVVYVPRDPHARPDGYALEHRLIMARMIGRPLDRAEVVHHKNGLPDDNRPENLELIGTQSDHMRHHNAERKKA